MARKDAKKHYAVVKGRVPGIYTDWAEAKRHVIGYPGAVYKGFATEAEARDFMDGGAPAARAPRRPPAAADRDVSGRLVIYTDGGAEGNPGPGGYGAVILGRDGPVELSGGFRRTTNNRMELMACIAALDYLEAPTAVALHSDSAYVVNGMELGWARGWRARGWVKGDGKPALNPDLWQRLLELAEKHDVVFVKVKGHAGVTWNERCDRLANAAMRRRGLPRDEAYEAGG
jgi:ribonuclease HI